MRLLSLSCLVCCALAVRAAEPPKTGEFRLTFTDHSPVAGNEEIAKRLGWEMAPEQSQKSDYTIAEESFEVYVPSTYTGEKAYGLFVFVNPGGNGKLSRGWKDSIDKHELIWVGPNNAGNDRFTGARMGLSVDAALNMPKQYKIDPKRVYIAGVSGGGRVASMLGVCYSDIFSGGYYMIGCNFYKQVQSVEQKGVFRRSYYPPPAKLFRRAREECKHVFLTGDTDGNREQTKLYYEGFKQDQFLHIAYFQVPGMAHRAPDAEWFEKGMAVLDAPLPAKGMPATRVATTQPATTKPVEKLDDEAIAAKLLKGAMIYVDNKQYDGARDKLRAIVKNFPQTKAGKEAARLLEEIKGK